MPPLNILFSLGVLIDGLFFAQAVKLVFVGVSGKRFWSCQAAGESGIERLCILMSDGRNVCVAEAVPALHILNGRWKRPSRHERIIEAHHQVGERHHLL